MTQPNYLKGVEVLYRSLRKSGSIRPLVVMVTKNIDEETRLQLKSFGCLVREVPDISPNPDLLHNYADVRYADVWSKLGVWNFTEFNRIVFLDADMLVIKNMDELFTMGLPDGWLAACHGCRCNPHNVASYPSTWCPGKCFYNWCEDDEMTANPPVSLDKYLNGGLLVLKPDKSVYQDMLTQLADITNLSDYFFAEQDFLNDFFRDRWIPLHYGYNALKTLMYQHPKMWNMEKVKNIHYIFEKPWARAPVPGDKWFELNRLWWEISET